MKQIITFLVCILCLTSCNFTEEITFNEDGSGEFVMSYDLAEVMKTMEEKMGGGKKKDEDKEQVKMDSVMYFKDMLVEKADSIAQLPLEEQDRLKALETVMIKMKMDEAAGVFNFGIGSTFTSLDELPATMQKLDAAKKLNAQNNPQMSKMDESAVAQASENMMEYVDFAYNGTSFSRILKDEYKSTEQSTEALDAEINQMGEDSKELFEEMSYTLVYHFPKPIKSVSNKNAVISADKKTVTLKMNFIDMVKTPEISALDVELEE